MCTAGLGCLLACRAYRREERARHLIPSRIRVESIVQEARERPVARARPLDSHMREISCLLRFVISLSDPKRPSVSYESGRHPLIRQLAAVANPLISDWPVNSRAGIRTTV